MDLQSAYALLLAVSLLLMFGQLAVADKKAVHLLFAVFCGSIAMMVAKKLSADAIGPYQYLIGLGACATCNGYWLVARALFRDNSAVALRHVVVACAVGLLWMSSQGYMFVNSIYMLNSPLLNSTHIALSEIAGLLSSCLLVLSFWEGCRGLSQARGSNRLQRIFYLASYGAALGVTSVIDRIFNDDHLAREWVFTSAALLILLTTQTLIYWRFGSKQATGGLMSDGALSAYTVSSHVSQPDKTSAPDSDSRLNETDLVLERAIKTALLEEKRFLQANLKVADLARELDVSEYRVSRVLHQQFDARNFNHFINKLRIKHAKTLLEDPTKLHWPVLVVGLESGFASVGPFTRAFKTFSGYTPNQYRQISACPESSL